MRKRILIALLSLCLLLAGCRKDVPPPEPEEPPAPAPVTEPARTPEEPAPEPLVLNRLTVEIVVNWEDADRILSSLEELSRLLHEALDGKRCLADDVVVTIGTAGGITAQALADGGVDAAFLPTADFLEMEEGKAAAVLESEDGGMVAAAAAGMDERFGPILAEALTGLEAGWKFTEICYPGMVFSAVE